MKQAMLQGVSSIKVILMAISPELDSWKGQNGIPMYFRFSKKIRINTQHSARNFFKRFHGPSKAKPGTPNYRSKLGLFER